MPSGVTNETPICIGYVTDNHYVYIFLKPKVHKESELISESLDTPTATASKPSISTSDVTGN